MISDLGKGQEIMLEDKKKTYIKSGQSLKGRGYPVMQLGDRTTCEETDILLKLKKGSR